MALEKRVSSKSIYKGRILDLRVDEVLLENGEKALREVIDHDGACGVAAFDENGDLLMVKQYRYPIGKELLEIPAGKMEKGESPEQCALRELEEETGYRAKKLTPLGKMYPAAAYDGEVVYMFYAEELSKTTQHLDADEFLTVQRVKFSEAVRLVMQGEIPDSKTQIAVLKIKEMIKESV